MKKNIFTIGFIIMVLISSSQAQQKSQAYLNRKSNAPFKLTLADYTDRVHAIWVGQIVCATIAMQFEHNERAVKWVDSLPVRWKYAPLDDDWYYEMITVKAFEKFGSRMTVEQLGGQWLQDSCGVWGSSHLAKLAMLKGIKAPASGYPTNNRLYNTIGPQFSSDVYGALTPGMPNLAGKIARHYGHINGYAEGTDGAVFVAGAISAAFNEKDVRVAVQKAAGLLDVRSPYRQCLDMVIADAKKGKSAREIFDEIEYKWRIEYSASNNAVANGGIVATCLWFGGGDFLKTLNLACSASDYTDADCNAANASSVIAAMYGLKAIPAHFVADLHNRIKGDRMVGDHLLPPIDEKITSLTERTVKVGLAILKDNGVAPVNNVLVIPNQKVITQPAELFQANDMVALWDPNWKIERASTGIYLEGDALVTSPKIAVKGTYLYRTLSVGNADNLLLTVATEKNKCWDLRVLIDNDKVFSKIIEAVNSGDKWQVIKIDLKKYKGKEVLIRLFHNVNIPDRLAGNAYWKKPIIQTMLPGIFTGDK